MNSTRTTSAATKIPQVTLVFWVMKIAATTLGETGGDLLAQTMKIGYAVSTLILLGIMFATLAGQLRVRRFSPALYWTVIATTSMAGTTISDYIDRTLKWGYYKGSVVLVLLLVASLAYWKAKFGSLSISRVNRFSLEVMFWTTVLIANTLGTALGDWMSDNTGLGFGRATLVITALLGLVALLHFRTAVNKVALFWAGFVLIQPFGATAGDFVTKSRDIGGNGFPTYYASAVLTAVLIALIVTTNRRSAATPRRSAPGRRTVAARSMAAASSHRDLAVNEEHVPAPAFAAAEPTAHSIEKLDDELIAVLQVAADSAAAFAEQQRALIGRVADAQRARQEVSDVRRAAMTEAAEIRARAEWEATALVERARQEAAKQTEEAERRIEELRLAEMAVLDRFQQAATLWESVFHNAWPAPPPDALDIREPSGITASSGNGAH